ncbi:ROK family transcriptional regulator [Pseudosulfitobacter sp. DSM 107133]|uniref:ROK family transcriptional regulator n=1 Tax=Pseudosulfitobacter sp. DSM 107133 TaxID=2883100 RepID=UPI000DF3F044|nr:ROK family transcriptional regulator [Pseudosulfitobacter sp. DSM 107133]UOA28513.1 N-acetylglucosamine repressor [Pseudosulfitobacter sp. DSM 107133]
MADKTPENAQRPYNDRLFLHLIRKAGQMSKAELTRASGLSAQSASVIVNRLVADGFLRAGKAVRGRIGQPSTPYQVNPDGATSIGVKVGRHTLEVVSMGLDYRIQKHITHRYAFPQLAELRHKVTGSVAAMLDQLPPTARDRFIGIGLALPDQLADWEATIGAPPEAMADWRDSDLGAELAARFDVPLTTLNDAAAACLAELETGNPSGFDSFVYVYVGTFIGGGIALGGRLFTGGGKAGAIGSMPAVDPTSGKLQQMIDSGSLQQLETRAAAAGLSPGVYTGAAPLDAQAQAVFYSWLIPAAEAIATACVSAQAFLDPQAIVIDTSLSRPLNEKLVAAVQAAALRLDQRGLAPLNIVRGTAGTTARATGSGIAPFQARFSVDRDD